MLHVLVGRGGSVVGFRAFRPEDRRFESLASRHVGTLDKSFTRSCLYNMMWRLAVKFASCNNSLSITYYVCNSYCVCVSLKY